MKSNVSLPFILALLFIFIMSVITYCDFLLSVNTAYFIIYSALTFTVFKLFYYQRNNSSRLLKNCLALLLGFTILSLLGVFLPFLTLSLFMFSATLLLIIFVFITMLKRKNDNYHEDLSNYKLAVTEQISALKKSNESLEETLIESQDELESKVQERTIELNIALQELEEANRELAEKSTLDDLTGLYNRRFYDQKIQAEFRRSRRNLSPLSLIVIDIDHFKNVNDNYGHLAGDYCLQVVSQKLKTLSQRSSDIACRYGGEEFCLILPETDIQGGKLLAEELRKNIEQLDIHFQQQIIKLTISCGISMYQQQDQATPENIFELADKALYQAKQSGRNRVVLAENANISNTNSEE